MKKQELGEVIRYLRKKRNIEAKDLCRGVCSEATLLRLEEGERLPDYMILELLLERLGKSIHKIEVIFSQEEYKVYCIQESIKAALLEKQYTEAKNELDYYESLEVSKQPLYKQYALMIKSILSIEEKDQSQAILYLEQAIYLTLPGFQLSQITNYLLGESEIILIMMWAEQVYKKQDICTYPYCEKEVLSYIEELCTDEELYLDVYPKVASIFIKMYESQGRYKDAIKLCEKTINLLTSNGIILYLLQFLLLYRRNLIQVGQIENAKKIEKQEECLKWIYQKYKIEVPEKEIAIWKKYDQKEIYLMPEIIKQERKRLRQSQEKVADIADIDQKTISRIETGKYAPKPGTFQRLKEHLKINRDIYNTLLVVNDFEVLEIRRNIGKAMCERDYEKVRLLFKDIKEKVPLSSKENMQYIGYMEVLLECQKKEINPQTAIEKCMELLSITREEECLTNLDHIVLGRHEILIVNFIAKMYHELGKTKKAIGLLEQSLTGYEHSKVSLQNHYVGISMIYGNLMNYYEEVENLEKAEEYCDKVIAFQLKCFRGNLIGEALMQKAYILERESGDRKTCQFYYKQAFQFYIFMKDIYSKNILEEHYRNVFQETI